MIFIVFDVPCQGSSNVVGLPAQGLRVGILEIMAGQHKAHGIIKADAGGEWSWGKKRTTEETAKVFMLIRGPYTVHDTLVLVCLLACLDAVERI